MTKINISTSLIILCGLLTLNACGGSSSKLTTKDLVPPVLTLKGSNPLLIDLNQPFTDSGATAIDNIDGDISNNITQVNNIDIAKAACYSQSYSVKDAAGNKSDLKRTVLVGSDAQRHAPNASPLAVEDSIGTDFTKTVTISPLANDSDSDCDTLTISSITQPTNGIAILNKNNTVSFNPQKMVGSFYFTYTVTDSHGGESIAGISIASHNPKDGNNGWPEAKSDAVSTKQGQSIFIDVVANDIESDGDNLIVQKIDDPKHGTTKLASNGIIYTPIAGFIGTDSFFYGVHDGYGHTDSAEVIITVTP